MSVFIVKSGHRFSIALIAGTLGGCAGNGSELEDALSAREPCDVAVPASFGRDKKRQKNPRACELPTAERVAYICAVHDLVRSADYVPTEFADDGTIISGDPTPEYSVSELTCSFADQGRSRASCRFLLTKPDGSAKMAPASADLTYIYWQDHGPTWHIYGTRWTLDKACLPSG